jgi:hypothetical protein
MKRARRRGGRHFNCGQRASGSVAAGTALAPTYSVSVTPLTATLYAGQSRQFSADAAVTWSATAGAIAATGLYTAPSSITAEQTVTITATSQADPGKSGTATVTLMPPVSVSLAPTTITLRGGGTQQFTATVANTSNHAVSWWVSPSGAGTIGATGLYTAPASITAQQTVTITAVSQADNTQWATAAVTLVPGTRVIVTPGRAILYGGESQQFAANTEVTWSNAGPTGLYTAPATVTAQQTVTITATSVTDPTNTGVTRTSHRT